jgi:hypothetical protein
MRFGSWATPNVMNELHIILRDPSESWVTLNVVTVLNTILQDLGRG